MSQTAFNADSNVALFQGFPLRVSPSHSSVRASLRIVLLLPIVLTLLALLGGVALAAVTEPTSLSLLIERPVAAAQIAAGVAMWAALLLIPASRALSRACVRRDIVIADGAVEIVRRTPLSTRRRSVPLTEYRGVAHHVRSSLSGLSHEIVLVHPQRSLTVTLITAERVTQAMLDEAKSLLGLPEISARTIYERNPSRGAVERTPVVQAAVA
jgi:hypothetical protein